MSDKLQRLCVLLVVLIGSLAFIATSPPIGLVKQKLQDVTIEIGKTRPIRQFAIFVADKQIKQSIFFGGRQTIKITSDTKPDLDGNKPLAFLSVARINGNQAADSCFAPTAKCQWKEHRLGLKEGNTSSDIIVESPTQFLLEENLRTTRGGTWLLLRFEWNDKQQQQSIRLTWQYEIERSYNFDEHPEFSGNSAMLNMSLQEIPVD